MNRPDPDEVAVTLRLGASVPFGLSIAEASDLADELMAAAHTPGVRPQEAETAIRLAADLRVAIDGPVGATVDVSEPDLRLLRYVLQRARYEGQWQAG